MTEQGFTPDGQDGKADGADRQRHEKPDPGRMEALHNIPPGMVGGEFLSAMLHEMRTPLSGVLGMLQLVLEGASAGQQRICLKTAHAAACSLLRIVEAAHDGARIDSGCFLADLTPFDLRQWAMEQTAAENLSSEWPDFRLNLTIDPEVPVLVLGDPCRLRQMLLNLIGHMVKERRVKSADLRLAAHREGGRLVVLFVIGENGAGLPEAVQGSIIREEGPPSFPCWPGQGFRLEVSRQIAARLGGAFYLDCSPENGYFCVLSMPFSVPAAARANPPAETAGIRAVARPKDFAGSAAGSILLVEDDPAICTFMELLLREKGWEVSVAQDGLEAVSARRQNIFDLVLMDVRMPNMDGLEATRLIRAEERAAGWAPLPIIGLTAQAGVQDREICMQTGMNGHLGKPVRSAELFAMIDRFLNRD